MTAIKAVDVRYMLARFVPNLSERSSGFVGKVATPAGFEPATLSLEG